MKVKKKKPGAHTGSKVVLSPTAGMENLTINKALGRLLRIFLHSLWEKINLRLLQSGSAKET